MFNASASIAIGTLIGLGVYSLTANAYTAALFAAAALIFTLVVVYRKR